MTIKEWQKKIYETAKAKGFYDGEERHPLTYHMLFVTEIAEASEEVRKGKPAEYEIDGKPEGEATELADAVIRIMDYFEHKGWDLEAVMQSKTAYNDTRGYRHGGKTV